MRLKAEANWIGRASAEGDVGRNERSEWHRCLGRASGGKRGDGKKGRGDDANVRIRCAIRTYGLPCLWQPALPLPVLTN